MSAVFVFFFLLAEPREGFDTDCASIKFGIIRHFTSLIFYLFSLKKKRTASIIFTFE